MNFGRAFEIEFDQLAKDLLDHGGVGVPEEDADHIAILWHFRNQVSMNEESRPIDIGRAGCLSQKFLGADVGGYFLSKVETGKDFELGIDDVFAAVIRRL